MEECGAVHFACFVAVDAESLLEIRVSSDHSTAIMVFGQRNVADLPPAFASDRVI